MPTPLCQFATWSTRSPPRPDLRSAILTVAAQEAGFAVAFGFFDVVGDAERLEVLLGRGAPVCDGVDVVPLQVVAAVAAVPAAGDAVEVGWRAQHQRGVQIRRAFATEV